MLSLAGLRQAAARGRADFSAAWVWLRQSEFPAGLDNVLVKASGDGETVHRLGLRLEVLDWAYGVSGFLAVTILVDGEEVFAQVGAKRYRGFHPARMIDPDEPALLPAQPARRTRLYAFPGLFGPGEGCVAAVIEDRGDQVAWADIRDYEMIDDDTPTAWGAPMGVPDLLFDSGQYRGEVARVMADPFWETDLLKTFRLLRRHMNAARNYLAGLGWTFGWAGQGKHGVWVEFWDASRRQLIVSLPDGTGTPAARAAAMAEAVLTTPPQRWPVVHCSICDPGQGTGTRPGTRPEVARPADHPAHAPPAWLS